MKILIPVSDNNIAKNNIAPGFHNAKYVCIYDCNDKTYQWMGINEVSNNTGNMSIDLQQKGIETLIINQMTIMALRLITEGGLKVFKAQGKDLKENIELFNNQQLKPFTMDSSMELSGCKGSCGSCKTSCD